MADFGAAGGFSSGLTAGIGTMHNMQQLRMQREQMQRQAEQQQRENDLREQTLEITRQQLGQKGLEEEARKYEANLKMLTDAIDNAPDSGRAAAILQSLEKSGALKGFDDAAAVVQSPASAKDLLMSRVMAKRSEEEQLAMKGAEATVTAEAGAKATAKYRVPGSDQYYAVPTGSGTLLLDKRSGMAIMLGVGPDGSPVQIGQPFRPVGGQGGQPSPISTGAAQQALPPQSGAMSAPAASQPSMVQPQPLMPPSIDAQAQGAVVTAQKQAELAVEKQAKFPKVQAALSSLNQQQTVVEESLDSAIKNVSGWSTGVGSWLSVLPATQAKALSSDLNTIKSNLGFDKLQQMRDNSPTGGALGNVTVQEIVFLQSAIKDIDQELKPSELKDKLEFIKNNLKELKGLREQAFQSDYAGIAPGAAIEAERAAPPDKDGWRTLPSGIRVRVQRQ